MLFKPLFHECRCRDRNKSNGLPALGCDFGIHQIETYKAMSTKYEEIYNVINTNSGFIPSDELANILGKEHTNLVVKMKKQLAEQLVKIMSCSKPVEVANGAMKPRTVYILPEIEAVAMAMSYDAAIGVEVMKAFKAYQATLVNIVKDPENAREVALDALFTEFRGRWKELDNKTFAFRDFFIKAAVEYNIGLDESTEILMDMYTTKKMNRSELARKEIRREFFVDFKNTLSRLQRDAFTIKGLKDPVRFINDAVKAKLLVEEKSHSLTKNNKTRGETKIRKNRQTAKKIKNHVEVNYVYQPK